MSKKLLLRGVKTKELSSTFLHMRDPLCLGKFITVRFTAAAENASKQTCTKRPKTALQGAAVKRISPWYRANSHSHAVLQKACAPARGSTGSLFTHISATPHILNKKDKHRNYKQNMCTKLFVGVLIQTEAPKRDCSLFLMSSSPVGCTITQFVRAVELNRVSLSPSMWIQPTHST